MLGRQVRRREESAWDHWVGFEGASVGKVRMSSASRAEGEARPCLRRAIRSMAQAERNRP